MAALIIRCSRYKVRPSFMVCAAAILLSLSVLNGCASDHAADVRIYRDVLDTTPAPLPATIASSKDPLPLSEALALVNRNNEQLAIEGENYVQSVLDKKRAVADFLPTISFSPAYSHNQGLSGPRKAKNDSYDDTLGLPVDGSWNLFNGYRDVATLYRDAATIHQREAILHDLESSLMLDVVNTFYAILSGQRSIAVLESSLKVQEERVRDIKARRDAGIARPLDVAQTEAVASEARVSLINARQDERNARRLLSLLLDVPTGQRPLIDDLKETYGGRTVQDWLAVALSQRQDLQAATAGVIAARHDVQNALGQYYPTITLDLEYLLTFNQVTSETGWNAVLRAHLPIFTAGRIAVDVRSAWSRVRQAILQETYTRRLIQQQVTTGFENWHVSAQRLQELHRKQEAARIAFQQADSSYNVGLATNLERLDAQDRLLVTELSIATEDFRLRQTYLSLLRFAGQLDGRVITDARTLARGPAVKPTAVASTAPDSPHTSTATQPSQPALAP